MALTCTSDLSVCQKSKMAQQGPGIQRAHMSALQGNVIHVTMSRICMCVCALAVTLVSKHCMQEQMHLILAGHAGKLK